MVQLSDNWSLVQDEFELLEICGKGSFGCVVKSRHKKSGRLVAIKHISDAFNYMYAARKVLREI